MSNEVDLHQLIEVIGDAVVVSNVAGKIKLSQDINRFVLRLIFEPIFNGREDIKNLVLTSLRSHIGWIGCPLWFAKGFGNWLPSMTPVS